MLPLSPQQVARALGGDVSGNSVSCPGPGHSPTDRSLRITIDTKAPDGFVVHSFAGDSGIQCKDYVRQKLGLAPFKANGKNSFNIVATYDYRDEDGKLLFQVCRLDPKNFRQRVPNGNDWTWKLSGTRRVLYRLPELLEAIAKEQTVFIAEGEKDVEALWQLGVPATCNPMGALKWDSSYSETLRDADTIIIPDKDERGEEHLQQVASSLAGVAARVRVLRLPAKDAADWIAAGGTAEQLWQLAEAAPEPETKPQASVPSLTEWLERDIAPLDLICGSFIHRTCRIIITGPTGLGKTMLGIAMAIRAAAGAPFLHWKAGQPCRVLYVDGEMPRGLMQDRLRGEVRRSGLQPETLSILSKEDFEDMPPLNTVEGQTWMDARIANTDPALIMLDNIQALVVGDHTKEESWSPVLPWVLSLTKRRLGQIWFHHTGHNEGHAYGPSTRQWGMDTCALLERVQGEEDLTFTIKFTKARERRPDNRGDFEDVTIALRNDEWEIVKGGTKASRLIGAPKVAFDLLKRAVCDAGEKPPACNHIPPDMLCVRESLWRRYCYEGQITETDNPDSRQKAFKRAALKLQELGRIGFWQDWVWPI